MGEKLRWWQASARVSENDFERLLRPYLADLYRTAAHLTGSPQDGEDLVQDLLLKLYPRHQALLQVEVLLPWLKRALYNLFVDQRRSYARTPFSQIHPSDSEALLKTLESADGAPEELICREEIQRAILSALDQLVPEHRAVVVLHDIEGNSLVELSRMLDIPIGTLKSRLFRARRQLQMLLSKWNPDEQNSVLGVESA